MRFTEEPSDEDYRKAQADYHKSQAAQKPMTHILITDLIEIRYMAYVPEEPKVIDFKSGRGFEYTKHEIAWIKYRSALEKAKRESLPFQDEIRIMRLMLTHNGVSSGESQEEVLPRFTRYFKPGIYQVPVEVEVVTVTDCKRQYQFPPAVCGSVNNCDCPYKKLVRLIPESKEESQEELWQSVNPNADRYIMLSNVRTNGMPKPVLELWSEIENWYGDLSTLETGEQLLTRLQKHFTITRKS